MLISIDGSIGSGKSELIKRLQTLGYDTIPEPVDEWKKYLEAFYTNPERYAFLFQMKILISQMTFSPDPEQITITERSSYTCRQIFVEMLKEEKLLNDLEIDLYDHYIQYFSQEPDTIVYIKTSPEICLQRIKQRNRDSEHLITLEYLTKLHNKHEAMLSKHDKVIIINGEQPPDTVFKDVVKALKLFPCGPNLLY